MKILIVRTYPDIMNIHAYNVQEIGLAKALVKKGHTCDIVLYYGKNQDKVEQYQFVDENTGERYSYHIFWLRGYNFVKNGYMPSLKKILPAYDVIQVDEYDLLYSWKLYTKMTRPTVIYHGLYKSTYTKGYNLKCAVFDRIFLNRYCHDNVIALTKSQMAGDFLREKGFQKIYPVGVGIDTDNFALCEKGIKNKSLLPDKTKYRLLYIGKIEERRNSLWLIELLQAVISEENAELVVIGTGEKNYLERFMEKARPYIELGNLIYLPQVSQKELTLIYPNCDLFVFPSRYEIFGMVLLEAMYFGLPVISSLNGGSSILIQNEINGIIMSDFNISRWANKIKEFIHKSAYGEQIGDQARKTINKKFLWTELSDKFLGAYQHAIDEFENKRDFNEK